MKTKIIPFDLEMAKRIQKGRLTNEEKIKLRLFQIIASNSDKLCDPGSYFTPKNVAEDVNEVYNELFSKLK